MERSYKSVISYADQRWGIDHAYKRNGFEFVSETGLRFWWVTPDFQNRLNRFKIRASKGESQADVASRLKVHRIWGCKNSRYELML